MSERSESFDPYHEWLEIPPAEQPPSFYRLLGVPEFEPNLDVIDRAAKKRTAYLHPMGSGPERESVHRLLSEIAKARRTLLSVESKEAYDEKQRAGAEVAQRPGSEPAADDVVSSAAPAIHIDTRDDSRSRSDKAAVKRHAVMPSSEQPTAAGKRAADAGVATGSRGTADRKNTRKRSPLKDWRLHAASIVTLLTVVIGFVIYMNSRAERRAATPMSAASTGVVSSQAQDNSDAVAKRNVAARAQRQVRTPRRTNASQPRNSGLKKSGVGKSQLAIALETQMQKSDANGESTKRVDAKNETAKETAASSPSEKNRKGKSQKFAKMKLQDGWLDKLPQVAEVRDSLDEAFDASKRVAALTFNEGRIEIQPVADGARGGSLMATDVKLGLGETVAFETNARKRLPDGMRIGVVAGPIRVRLDPKKNNLEVRIHGQKLGSFTPPVDAVIRLAVIRDQNDAKAFRWVVQAGGEALTGQAKMKQNVADSLSVGLLYSAPRKPTQKPVWMRRLAVGVLPDPPQFKLSEVVVVTPPK